MSLEKSLKKELAIATKRIKELERSVERLRKEAVKNLKKAQKQTKKNLSAARKAYLKAKG